MNNDRRREHRRKERAHHEAERMLPRYPLECGPCRTRAATPEEIREILGKVRRRDGLLRGRLQRRPVPEKKEA